MKTLILIAAAALLTASPALAQTFDANPTVPFTYGSGNGYAPANAVVLTTPGPFSTIVSELAVRAHVPTQPANATGGTGIYTFGIGSNVSFDFSAFGSNLAGALITVTNVGTGDDASFLAALLGSVQGSGAIQGSQQLGFGFLNGSIDPLQDINFTNLIDSTYRIDLSGGGQTVTAFAQIGNGAIAAVPEPATWAMMLMGFGAMGFALRRRKRVASLTQMA